MWWPHVGPHVSWPPGAHSAGRQAPWLEMEPVALNDFRGVFRGSSAVACGQSVEAFGPWPVARLDPPQLVSSTVCFPTHDFRGGLPRIFHVASKMTN